MLQLALLESRQALLCVWRARAYNTHRFFLPPSGANMRWFVRARARTWRFRLGDSVVCLFQNPTCGPLAFACVSPLFVLRRVITPDQQQAQQDASSSSFCTHTHIKKLSSCSAGKKEHRLWFCRTTWRRAAVVSLWTRRQFERERERETRRTFCGWVPRAPLVRARGHTHT